LYIKILLSKIPSKKIIKTKHMKKNYLVYLLLFVVAFSACKNKGTAEQTETAKDSTPKAPYTITLEEVTNSNLPALQAFAWAAVGTEVLIVGGRNNGFHTFDDEFSTFPSNRNNPFFYVINLDSGKVDSLPIPSKYLLQLRSTNMESYNDGQYLYCVGGYGSNCATDSPSCYQTFPNLTTIDIAAAMKAIKNNKPADLLSSIKMITDPRMQVTGGELHKIGDWFYLVFGQNFNTIYSDNATGIYTQEVRRFQIDNSGSLPKITGYAADTCTWDDSSFHRRDLVVLESHDVNGNPNITVYGGVFTPVANNDYQTPIYISQTDATTGATSITTDNSFLQMFNQYAAPNIYLYDRVNKTNYTTILGGITQYYYDNGTLVNSNNTQAPMPWSNYITTIVRKADGTSVEYPQQTPTLSGFIGGEAIFVPHINVPFIENKKAIDFSALKTDSGNGFMLGYMYGGIQSDASQSTGPHSTHASNRLFKVYIKK
jgi:hypothetical protein